MKVIAYTKYDREAASTRQRLLQYLPGFRAAGIEVEYRPLLSTAYVRSLATGERQSRRDIAWAYAQRLHQLRAPHQADLIWIYAELFPWLPGAAERLAFRPGLPVIYDMDDAFFVPYDLNGNLVLRRLLEGKLNALMGGAAAVTCGNAYLADHARPLCRETLIVPTVVDTARYSPHPRSAGGPLVVGWIGSPSTWPQVRPLIPLLAQLSATGDVRIKVVGAGAKAEADRFPGLELANWSEADEIAEVQAMDIGIMPLQDDPFVRGKSGYKLIQYMACGLPVVASPIGVNSQLVQHGVNGLLASSPDEWKTALDHLISDPALRRHMGEAGRVRAVEHYSLASQLPRLIDLFRSVVASS